MKGASVAGGVADSFGAGEGDELVDLALDAFNGRGEILDRRPERECGKPGLGGERLFHAQ